MEDDEDLEVLVELRKLQEVLGEVQNNLTQAITQTSDISDSLLTSAHVMTHKPVQGTDHGNPEDVTSSMTSDASDDDQSLPPQDNISLSSVSAELVETDDDQIPPSTFVKPRTFDRSSTLFSEDQVHLSPDTLQSLMYPVRVSSPLKQSYIPETISESDEDDLNDKFRPMTVQNFADSAVLTPMSKQPREAMVLSDSELLEVAEEQDEEDDESEESDDVMPLNRGRRESLLDPINHLREVFYAQSLENNVIHEQPELEEEDPQDFIAGKSPAEKLPSEESVVRDVDMDQQSMQRSVDDSISTTTSNSVRFAPDAELRRNRTPPLSLISADVRKLRNAAQRIQAYISKTELLAQEDTGISKWISLNMGMEPPVAPKNMKKTASTSTSSTTSTNSRFNEYSGDSVLSPLHISQSLSRTSLDIALQPSSIKTRPIPIPNSSRPKTSILSSLGRRSSMNKSSRPANTFMLSPVMNQPVANSSAGALLSGPSQSPPAPETPKRQRRFSFQTVTSLSTKFSLGSQTPPSPVSASPTLPASAATAKNGNGAALGTLVEVDDHALNKLCDVLPLVDREVLARYLQLAGGRDDLMAVSLYMRDFKSGKIAG